MSKRPGIDRLRQLLTYYPLSGVLTWKPRPRDAFPSARAHSTWNARYAGEEAGHVHSSGYRVISLEGVKLYAHHIAFAMHNGVWPKHGIDHRGGDKDNNRPKNLRDVPQRINMQNRRRSTNLRVDLRGVAPQGNKFKARIKVNNKSVDLGLFATAEEAHAAYEAARAELHEGYVP